MAAAVASQLSRAFEVPAAQIDVVDALSVAVTWRHQAARDVVGLWLHQPQLEHQPFLRHRTIAELAFYAVHLGILEPRAIEYFDAEDERGVRLLPVSEWVPDMP